MNYTNAPVLTELSSYMGHYLRHDVPNAKMFAKTEIVQFVRVFVVEGKFYFFFLIFKPHGINFSAPEPEATYSNIMEKDLPHCQKENCGGLLRPHIIWFGENLEKNVLENAEDVLSSCDLFLVVGTSSVVYPAAMFAPQLAQRGVPVAEFNLEATPATDNFW